MLWTIQDKDNATVSSQVDQSSDHGYEFRFLNQTNFIPFADSYIRNLTILVSLAKKLYPHAKIFLQHIIPPEAQGARLIGSKTVQIMNTLVTKAANKSNVQVFAFDKFIRNIHISPNDTVNTYGGYEGTILRRIDGLHPTDIVNRNFINLMLNIARYLGQLTL